MCSECKNLTFVSKRRTVELRISSPLLSCVDSKEEINGNKDELRIRKKYNLMYQTYSKL
jgi:hypothetical protein